MRQVLNRYLGPVTQLPAGMWCRSDRLARVALRCPKCGGLAYLDPPLVADASGRISPEFRCPTVTCGFREWLTLEAWLL